MSTIVAEFTIFNCLPHYIKQNIKTFSIYEKFPNYRIGFCITADDNVYGLGEGVHKILGYSEDSVHKNYTLISELCGKNIEQFYYCRHSFMFARSKSNQIYSCGHNYSLLIRNDYYDSTNLNLNILESNSFSDWGNSKITDLARKYENHAHLKPQKVQYFDDKNVIDFDCDQDHCLALTSEGVVYGWGHIKFGKCSKQVLERIKSGVQSYLEECERKLLNEKQNLIGYGQDLIKLIDDYLENHHNGFSYHFILVPIVLNTILDIKEKIKFIYCNYGSTHLITSCGKIFTSSSETGWDVIQDNIQVIKVLRYSNDLYSLSRDGEVKKHETSQPNNEYKVTKLEIPDKVTDIFKKPGSGYFSLICETHTFIYECLNGQNVKKLAYKDIFNYFLSMQLTHKTIHLVNGAPFINNLIEKESCAKVNNTLEAIDMTQAIKKEQDPKCLKRIQNFNDLPENVESNVKNYYQSANYYSLDSFTFIVMNDNKVYSFGDNSYGKLGFGHTDRVADYTIIPELFDQNIEEFYEGNSVMFARSTCNQIFSWGSNDFGKPGNHWETHIPGYSKPRKIQELEDKHIIQISCGHNHCLGLSSEGIVYGWGNSRWGQLGFRNDSDLNKICQFKIDLNKDSVLKFKFINTSGDCSILVTFEGKPYIFGKSRKGIEIDSEQVEKMFASSKSQFEKKYFYQLKSGGHFWVYNNDTGNSGRIYSQTTFTDITIDLSGCALLQSDQGVYETNDFWNSKKLVLIKTNFINFYDYFLHKYNMIYKTINISSDGYLVTNEIKFNANYNPLSDEKPLTIEQKNVFDKKYEKMFDERIVLGTGGFGTVFKARHKYTDEEYAVKRVEVKGELNANLEEIKILSKLNTDFVVQYFESWIEAKVIDKRVVNYIYIQMQLCSQNLKDVIESMDDMIDEKFKIFIYFISCELFKELLESVDYLHSLNIIHRDLKPENVLISIGINGRFLKLCDFGLSTISENVLQTEMVGTEYYMAPEVLNSLHYNHKSDIYSLAVIATQIFHLSVERIEFQKLNSLEHFAESYSSTNFEGNYWQFLKMLSSCLFQSDYNERPDCNQMLAKINEWNVNINLISKSDQLYIFREYLKQQDDTFWELYFETKIGNFSANIVDKEDDQDNSNNQIQTFNTFEEIYSKFETLNNSFVKNYGFSTKLKIFRIFREMPDIFQLSLAVAFPKETVKSIRMTQTYFALIVMDDDRVYGVHHLEYMNKDDQFTIIPELCNQWIEEFFEGPECMFAKNDKGQIFGWGLNIYGQLMNRPKNSFKPEIITHFDQKIIAQISCGSKHCLALSSDGLVFGWGSNEFGQLGFSLKKDFFPIPNKSLIPRKCKMIGASLYSSCALTIDGNIYFWGADYCLKIVIFHPVKLQFNNIDRFCMAKFIHLLLNDGSVLKYDILEDQLKRIETEVKFTDICPILSNNNQGEVTLYQADNCLYQTEKDEVKMGENIIIKTKFKDLHDYYWQTFSSNYKTIHILSDGYLMTNEIVANTNWNDQHLLTFKYQNVIDLKYKREFEEIYLKVSGSFGKVSKVKSKANNQFYAIKKVIVKGDLNEYLKKFRNICELNCDYVIQYIDSWIESRVYETKFVNFGYIQMQWYSSNLREVIQLMDKMFDKRLEVFEYFISCKLFEELIECVCDLHSNNVILANLKPENILISSGSVDTFLKLCDIGFAQNIELNSQLENTDGMVYMAPEVMFPNQCTQKSDIYSLGLIATQIFNLKDNVTTIKNNKHLEHYSDKYSKANIQQLFRKLLEVLSLCLSAKNIEKRPNCYLLLSEINDLTIDINTVRTDPYFPQFLKVLEKPENSFIKTFFKTKLDSNNDSELKTLQVKEPTILPNESDSKQNYIKDFEIIGVIGCGTYGTILKIKNRFSDKCFALKKLKMQYSVEEIQILSNLKSDFVVQYYDSWIEEQEIDRQFEKYAYIQMELCSTNLRIVIKSMDRITEKRFDIFNYFISCELFRELTECVDYLHQLKPPIIHRDLKPENVLISGENGHRFLKLCDFGLAKVHHKSIHTRMVGTDLYMAPEVKYTKEYNLKSDIYSLAIIATEIFQFEDKVSDVRKQSALFGNNNYTNENLREKYSQLLEMLSICLFTKDFRQRPDSRQLLDKMIVWSVNRQNILNNNIISEFQNILEINENIFFRQFFDTKIKIL